MKGVTILGTRPELISQNLIIKKLDQIDKHLPTIKIEGINEYYSAFKKVELEGYNSEKNLMSKDEIHQMFVEGGFLN